MPESFKVLIKELQSLCLDIKVLNEKREVIEIRDDDDDEISDAPVRSGREDDRDDLIGGDSDVEVPTEYEDIDDITDIDDELGTLDALGGDDEADFADFDDPLSDIDDDDIQ